MTPSAFATERTARRQSEYSDRQISAEGLPGSDSRSERRFVRSFARLSARWMKNSSAPSRTASSRALSAMVHLRRRRRRISTIQDEVERGTEILDLGVLDQTRIHVVDHVRARQRELLVAVGTHEPALEV